MTLLERFRRRRGLLTQDEESPQEYEDVTKLFILIKKDGTAAVLLASYFQEYGPIENVELVTFNRPYEFSFSGVTFAKTVEEYQVSYFWKDPVKVTVTKDPYLGTRVFVGEY